MTVKDSFEVEVTNVYVKREPLRVATYNDAHHCANAPEYLPARHTATFFGTDGQLSEVGVTSDMATRLRSNPRLRVTFEAIGPDLPPVIDTNGLRQLSYRFEVDTAARESYAVYLNETLNEQGGSAALWDVEVIDFCCNRANKYKWEHKDGKLCSCQHGTLDNWFSGEVTKHLRSVFTTRLETDAELRERVKRAWKALDWYRDLTGISAGHALDSDAKECGLKREHVPTLKTGPGAVAATVERMAQEQRARPGGSSVTARRTLQLVTDLAGAVRELAAKVDK